MRRYILFHMIRRGPAGTLRWLFSSTQGVPGRLIPRWIFLRALAAIYFSAFFSLLFQIKGLIGPNGILPAQQYLPAVAEQLGKGALWFAPSLFWLNTSNTMLMAVTWLGLIASIVAFFNLWPRLSFFICFTCFLSFIGASSIFSSYQSDGMLLEAGFIALFFAPRGLRPGWGADHPPSRASLFLLQWEWFRIYFESGLVKLLSGDVEWRNFTAMDEYYQNGPLPTWIGWYAEHLAHWFHAASVGATLGMELVIVFMLFFPRRVRLICFFIVTPWEVGVILTANYTFLNYLVLVLGFLLLDDGYLARLVPTRFRFPALIEKIEPPIDTPIEQSLSILAIGDADVATADLVPTESTNTNECAPSISQILRNGWEGKNPATLGTKPHNPFRSFATQKAALRLAIATVFLTLVAYNTTIELIGIPWQSMPTILTVPVSLLSPFRIANQYGLFAVMTRGRYEIEFQGSNDGNRWTAYPFRNKPQALNEAPRIYAPYQPRFDWNLWFASLGDWRQNEFVPLTEERLLVSDGDVLALFRSNPFPQSPPRYIRAVLWQYWFTSMDEKRRTGNWWTRAWVGIYAPVLAMTPDGRYAEVQPADQLPDHD